MEKVKGVGGARFVRAEALSLNVKTTIDNLNL